MSHGTDPKIQPVLFLLLCAACFHLGSSEILCFGPEHTGQSNHSLANTPDNVAYWQVNRIDTIGMTPSCSGYAVLHLRSGTAEQAGPGVKLIIVAGSGSHLEPTEQQFTNGTHVRKQFGDTDARSLVILGFRFNTIAGEQGWERRFIVKFKKDGTTLLLKVQFREIPNLTWIDTSVSLTITVPGLVNLTEIKSYVKYDEDDRDCGRKVPQMCHMVYVGSKLCSAGTFREGYIKCTACPVGTVSGVEATSCTGCPDGKVPGAGSTSLENCQYAPCTAGKYMTESGCQKCPENSYSAAGATGCTGCPDGEVSGAGSTSVDNCQYVCEAGSYKADEGCVSCGPNTYSEVPDAAACTDCPAGTYNAVPGSSSKEDCEPKRTSISGYPLPNALKVGDKFSFSGVYDASAPRFGFDVESDKGDYLFRVAFRPPGDPAGGNRVVMNSRIGNKDGKQLRAPAAPFKDGEEFRVRVECQEKRFVVYFNDVPLREVSFEYRYGLEHATYFSVWGGDGKIAINKVVLLDGSDWKRIVWKRIVLYAVLVIGAVVSGGCYILCKKYKKEQREKQPLPRTRHYSIIYDSKAVED